MSEEVNIIVSMEELQALEAVVYAARCQATGHKSWITVDTALAHLDKIRDIIEDENQGVLFENENAEKSDKVINNILAELENLTNKVDKIGSQVMDILTKKVSKNKNPWGKDGDWINKKY